MYNIICSNKYCDSSKESYQVEEDPGTTECGLCGEPMVVTKINE